MPYRQPWDTGLERITELRHAAAHERVRREAIDTQTSVRASLAVLARAAATRLSRIADRLDARSTRFVTTRPDGA